MDETPLNGTAAPNFFQLFNKSGSEINPSCWNATNHLRIGFLFGSGFATASALSIARRQIFNASAHGTPFAQARAAASRAILFRALARYIVICSFRFLSLEGRTNLDQNPNKNGLRQKYQGQAVQRC